MASLPRSTAIVIITKVSWKAKFMNTSPNEKPASLPKSEVWTTRSKKVMVLGISLILAGIGIGQNSWIVMVIGVCVVVLGFLQ